MNLTTLILIAAVVLLAIIGAANRRKLALFLRIKTKKVLKNAIDPIDLLESKIEEMRKSAKKMIEAAGELKANYRQTETIIENHHKKIEEYRNKASKYKREGNEVEAKRYLQLSIVVRNKIKSLEENLKFIGESIDKIEGKISTLKIKISQNNLQIVNLKARKKTNDAIKTASGSMSFLDGKTMNESIEEVSTELSNDLTKLEYIQGHEEKEEEDVALNDEVESEFEKL